MSSLIFLLGMAASLDVDFKLSKPKKNERMCDYLIRLAIEQGKDDQLRKFLNPVAKAMVKNVSKNQRRRKA